MSDIDPGETKEWLDALSSLYATHGEERVRHILTELNQKAADSGVELPTAVTSNFCNTIPANREKVMPGDLFMERRIRSLIRWNALAMVMRANERSEGIGGHIATFSSAATLYDVGFNYFFRGATADHLGDLIFFQGHSSPGMYARSFLEGRFSAKQLDNFRREVDVDGLSSYPHPWLMPDYWQFPTVSMGLGPIQAIYQAHIMNYLSAREIVSSEDRKVWTFLGDGECDEPETLGAISLAGRERLENLIFVINCNLQRLDGLVRGNGKIIQELEGIFRGAGWNVIKVVWGRHWDPLLEKDKSGLLLKRMNEVCDGELQNYKFNGGAYTRKHFFGKYPELLDLVKDLSDDQIMALNRGGHDPYKVYAAYAEATAHKGSPTVILAHTVKGYGLGDGGQAANDTHSVKKLNLQNLRRFRDRFGIPISDEQLETVPYYRPEKNSPELSYMRKRRSMLGGNVPSRRSEFGALSVPNLEYFEKLIQSSGDREISTTMAFVRILTSLIKHKEIGKRVVPIVPDEARTFGMEGMFRQMGIFSAAGQKYVPHDREQIMYYKEDKKGIILEEGINEAGAMSAWLALATSYSTHQQAMIPFYIFYSMFGFQRIGDLAWASGDSQARGFLIGATAGRTTLNGEGLQHQDGHSHILANTIPNCKSYDATYAYELAVIIQDGLERMYGKKENFFYYITTMNENYNHPSIPEGVEQGIIAGVYKVDSTKLTKNKKKSINVNLMGAGTILHEVIAASKILADDYSITSDIWSLTSINELVRDGQEIDRWNMLNPEKNKKMAYIERILEDSNGPFVIATDYMKAYGEQLRKYIPDDLHVLGTDGFGRSDSRETLRNFFEVDRYFIVIATLNILAQQDKISANELKRAIKTFDIDVDKLNPLIL
ncbi:MAG: pyruvate dehydrogenase (acetyl-transferring), homodimeric type [Pseudomonadota bacterium]|nr:pyruvate dehydrogenase (acetyl-transferring), homodimeric type [Pseudomonadota bacterium]MEC7455026.1 pyruvate dehydrogenase (acetyl-transferring), homodimeric type [Pseudomonadota bacterium]MEC7636763.1 pyruvate dehydrogenase (acetyl-transferring), homodimeric type [Pseudomonadota bacterium]MEC8499134.1 pyruvate dehydrogenase (acetyl-transferring), homodimeric type [Pseudomonadota bacterium]MED5309986.1 pyruvate dehydrogenase (acetyl-transferring), homodimeric type [Pseudomonadota bacterium|tara:strand:- start:1306 stop:3966 length:2661 start_codon:yes stop_codon:yes gene_type:complete